MYKVINSDLIKVNLCGYGLSFSLSTSSKNSISTGVNLYKSNK